MARPERVHTDIRSLPMLLFDLSSSPLTRLSHLFLQITTLIFLAASSPCLSLRLYGACQVLSIHASLVRSRRLPEFSLLRPFLSSLVSATPFVLPLYPPHIYFHRSFSCAFPLPIPISQSLSPCTLNRNALSEYIVKYTLSLLASSLSLFLLPICFFLIAFSRAYAVFVSTHKTQKTCTPVVTLVPS